MSLAAALVALLALPALSAGAPGAPDDPLPAALDALLLAAEDTVFFGVPDVADGAILASTPVHGSGRSVVAVGDVDGDGWAEFAVGNAPGAAPALAVRDGRTAALEWQASLDGGGFRTLDGLAARGPWLAAGVSSARGRVECRASATGALRWSQDLAPRGAPAPADVLAVLWLPDLDGDGEDDLLVAGGRAIDAVVALSGLDGHRLWTRPTAGCATALAEAGDLDGDGRADVFVAGGSSAPFAAAVSGADGAPLWSVPLPGPGSAVLRLPDVDGDGTVDLAAGCMDQPDACLLGLSGSDGSPLWTAHDITDDVTALATISDLDFDGAADLAVGSFDNAVTTIGSRAGDKLWHHECSTVNTGALLDLVALGDLDGNGAIDVASASVDHQAYVFDGEKGHLLASQDLRARGIAVAGLPDGDGDGRLEFVAAGDGQLMLLGGASGTASGPVVDFQLPGTLAGETTVIVFALPQKTLVIMGSLGTGQLVLPGFSGALGLDLATLTVVHFGTGPAAGETGVEIGPYPPALAGSTVYFQAATIFAPGWGQIGAVQTQVVPLQ